MTVSLSKIDALPLEGTVVVPHSKSISNRLLLLQALSKQSFNIQGLSEAEDTLGLERLLKTNTAVLDCGPAGTTFRFLTAYCAIQDGREVTLTGSDRMKQRPIAPLVEALNAIGADLSYLEQTGLPPLRISGRKLEGGKVAVDGTTSSQFTSALLMIAPLLNKGLEIESVGDVVSRPYLDMTITLMHELGVEVVQEENCFKITPQSYQRKDMQVERDWSAVSYWYELVALAPASCLFVPEMKLASVQGDSVAAKLFTELGVHTEEREGGIFLRHVGRNRINHDLTLDMGNCPDLVPAVAATCAGLGQQAVLENVKQLRYKESDRITALITELDKIGVIANYESGNLIILPKKDEPLSASNVIETYNDHRMAMAFAPLVLCAKRLQIDAPDVVNKSYPGYWQELEQFFKLTINP
jgi:3-phosphoshikimate 1-carboxyvinyltransferase